jgi:hypothetical protein
MCKFFIFVIKKKKKKKKKNRRQCKHNLYLYVIYIALTEMIELWCKLETSLNYNPRISLLSSSLYLSKKVQKKPKNKPKKKQIWLTILTDSNILDLEADQNSLLLEVVLEVFGCFWVLTLVEVEARTRTSNSANLPNPNLNYQVLEHVIFV